MFSVWFLSWLSWPLTFGISSVVYSLVLGFWQNLRCPSLSRNTVSCALFNCYDFVPQNLDHLAILVSWFLSWSEQNHQITFVFSQNSDFLMSCDTISTHKILPWNRPFYKTWYLRNLRSDLLRVPAVLSIRKCFENFFSSIPFAV